MTFVGNLLWFVFGGGVLTGTLWVLLGLLCCATVVGIPLGVACLRIASFAYFPFGKELVPVEWTGERRVSGTGIVNALWCVLVGFWLSTWFALSGLACCLSIVGIPFGLARFKLCVASFAPLGKRVVPSRVAEELASRQVRAETDEIVKREGDKKDVLLAVPVLLFVALATAVVVRIACPALFVRTDEAVSFRETVEKRQGAESVAYIYRGEASFEAVNGLTKISREELNVVLFAKCAEHVAETPRPLWRRVLNRLAVACGKSAAARGDALVITDHDYVERDNLHHGKYVFLGVVQSDALGDNLIGLPVYLDGSAGCVVRNRLLATLQRRTLSDLF